MPTLEAVDAKIERARSELRLLKTDIAAFCEERARLIVREECDDERERWVYRGDTPKAPIQWSIRAGEFAYNLRSGLDHLVWQMVKANGGSPANQTEFPIQDSDNQRSRSTLNNSLKGISCTAQHYIKSVQPFTMSEWEYYSDSDRVPKGLVMLHKLCNIDKHRHLVVASVRWSGHQPKFVPRISQYQLPNLDANSYLDSTGMQVITQELTNGQALIETCGMRGWQYLEFRVDAYFDEGTTRELAAKDQNGDVLPVVLILDACIDSVEMVVSHLRKEID